VNKDRGILSFLVAAVFVFTFCITAASFAQKTDPSKEISTGRAAAIGEKTAPSEKTDKAGMEKAAKAPDENKEISTGRDTTTKAPAKKKRAKAKARAKAKKRAPKVDQNREISTGRDAIIPDKAPEPKK
jgi:hypothetical protein